MEVVWIVLLLVSEIGLAVTAHSPTLVTKEFCSRVEVNISCPANYAIMIHKAHFGRMMVNSPCVSTPIDNYDGCKADVRSAMDKLCSGRETCKFKNPHDDFFKNPQKIHGHVQCPEDVTSYLQVEYICIEVVPVLACRNRKLAVPYTEGYLSSTIAQSTNLGTDYCPWEIEVPAGQVINITVFNFFRHNIKSGSDPCNTYGTISETQPTDTHRGSGIVLCNRDARSKWIYTSSSSKIQLAFKVPGPDDVVLIRYQVSGCPDIQSIPPQKLAKRTGDQAEIICLRDKAEEKFYLTCKGTEWLGYMNCSAESLTGLSGSEGIFSTTQAFPYGLVIIVAVGVALGIFLGGLLLLCVSMYMKRRYHKEGNYIQPDYQVEYNLAGGGNVGTDNIYPTYPTYLHQRHADEPPTTMLSSPREGTLQHPSPDTLLQYMRCAKHGIAATTGNSLSNMDSLEHFNNNSSQDTLTTLPPTAVHGPSYKTERTNNQINLMKSKDHEPHFPKL